MTFSRTVRTLALVPMFGALSLSPSVASANQVEGKISRPEGSAHARIVPARLSNVATFASSSGGSRRLAEGKSVVRGWLKKNPVAGAWSTSVYTAIQKRDYSAFLATTAGTQLGSTTSELLFERVADASDALAAGRTADAAQINADLRTSGYNFKKLFRESVAKRFPKNSKGEA